VEAETGEIMRWNPTTAGDVNTVHLELLLKPERSRKSHWLEREFDMELEHRFLRVGFEKKRRSNSTGHHRRLLGEGIILGGTRTEYFATCVH
jgi:hypothetical protein